MAAPRAARGRRFLIEALLARCRFPAPATPVTCAVSGGADSSALLILARASGCEVTAVHVDHGLRPGSDKEAALVAETAHRYGAAFRAETALVEPGPNLEARARSARAAALPVAALTGHTADDQAETVLLNLLRGAGLDGLRGIGDPDRRPLLALRRTETTALCASEGVLVVDDESNRNPSFTRNRVRHELLPLLADVAQRDPVPVLGRLADLAGDEARLLDELAAPYDSTDCAALASAPVPLARRALRTWLRDALGGYPPDAAAIERVLGVARGDATGTDVVAGLRVRRTAGRLRVERG